MKFGEKLVSGSTGFIFGVTFVFVLESHLNILPSSSSGEKSYWKILKILYLKNFMILKIGCFRMKINEKKEGLTSSFLPRYSNSWRK